MGSDHHEPEEAPCHRVSVDGFWMQRHAVTNHEFGLFVDATGYTTVAERPLDPADYPGAPAANLQPGSMVFTPTAGPVDLRDLSQWWRWLPGAYWRRPEGPGSNLKRRQDHPVVHIAYEDAEAYADWARRSLPTEAEWERAARGHHERAAFTWGDDERPDGRLMANYWDGPDFPWRTTGESGFTRTSPVGSFPANDFGLYDMAGNVWEWTTDWYTDRHDPDADTIVLRTFESPRWHGLGQPGSAPTTHRDTSQGDQRRLAPVRRHLLPAIPPRRQTTADGRHRHDPHRLPLHHSHDPH